MKKLIVLFIVFILTPSLFSVVVTNGIRHEFEIKSGKIYRHFIELYNKKEEAIGVKMKVCGLLHNAKGQAIFDKDYERSILSWTSLEHNHFIVPAKSKVKIPFEIKVPDNVTGTYWGVIMVEPASTKPEPQTKKGTMVFIKTRVAIPIICQAEPTEKNIKIVRIKEVNNILEIDIKNISGTYVRGKLTVEIGDFEFEAKAQGLYPECSVRFKIDISELEDDLYKAVILFDAGGDDLWAFRREFRKGEEPPPPEPLPPLPIYEPEKERKPTRKKNQLTFYISGEIGNRRKGLRLNTRMRMGDFGMNAGTSEYWFLDRFYSTYSTGLNFRHRPISLGMSARKFGEDWYTTFSSGLALKNLNIYANYYPKVKTASLMATQKIFKNHTLSFMSYFRKQGNFWSLRYSVPFTIKF